MHTHSHSAKHQGGTGTTKKMKTVSCNSDIKGALGAQKKL